MLEYGKCPQRSRNDRCSKFGHETSFMYRPRQSGTSAEGKSNREDSSESEVIVGVNYFPLITEVACRMLIGFRLKCLKRNIAALAFVQATWRCLFYLALTELSSFD